MDSPRRPEASSPVVLQHPSIAPQVVANNGRSIASVSPFRRDRLYPISTIGLSLGGVGTPASMTASAPSSARRTTRNTNVDPFLNAMSTASTGRTTRSRKRSARAASDSAAAAAVPCMTQSSTRERSAARTSTATPNSTTAPSRKRKASSSTNERRRKMPRAASNRKKPPPGADLKKPPPQAGKSKKDEDKKHAPKCDCCICMEAVEPKDVAKIDGCEHRFCFGCIEKWSERENKCPLCKTRFNKIERIQKKYKKGCKNTKKVKQRDQRSDISSGVALEGLLRKF